MVRYLEVAEQLKEKVNQFVETYLPRGTPTMYEIDPIALEALGHIINLAVRCNPRQPQGTVRKNIVAKAMENYCDVYMTRELDDDSGHEYNLIHIHTKQQD